MRYIISIDQSTQGTKAMLFDIQGRSICRTDMPHDQKINDKGWVSHDPIQIYSNTLECIKALVSKSGISKTDITALGITNQRETSLIWDRTTGMPIADAVVWQCGRAAYICDLLAEHSDKISNKTGLKLSPYFPAAKWSWLLKNTADLHSRQLCAGTIDSWLIYKLTDGASFKTDLSNASRTQLFNISSLEWDDELLELFDIPKEILPEVCYSDSCFGYTDFEGFLPTPIPINCVMGDSHAALFGQGCKSPGMMKATYGTGSSVMMNIGDRPIFADNGIATSIAWGIDGKIFYVLEGNINYTGAVTSWIVNDLRLIDSPKAAGQLAAAADSEDTTFLIPAFTGLGAPYWRTDVRAMFCGMSRTTGRAELVKAAEESIAYQICDVVCAVAEQAGTAINQLRVDGGPTADKYLMQFQSDILNMPISVADSQELSAIGAAYCAGIASGLYSREVLLNISYHSYLPKMDIQQRNKRLEGWKAALAMLIK